MHVPTDDKIDDRKDSLHEELEHVLDQLFKHHMKMLLDQQNKLRGLSPLAKYTDLATACRRS
jgi:hypothetical protein